MQPDCVRSISSLDCSRCAPRPERNVPELAALRSCYSGFELEHLKLRHSHPCASLLAPPAGLTWVMQNLSRCNSTSPSDNCELVQRLAPLWGKERGAGATSLAPCPGSGVAAEGMGLGPDSLGAAEKPRGQTRLPRCTVTRTCRAEGKPLRKPAAASERLTREQKTREWEREGKHRRLISETEI